MDVTCENPKERQCQSEHLVNTWGLQPYFGGLEVTRTGDSTWDEHSLSFENEL